MTWTAAGVQTGTDANASGIAGTTGATSLALGDATIYKPNVMLDIRGTLTVALRETIVFDNGTDTAVGGTVGAARDHDVQIGNGGRWNAIWTSVVNGVTLYAPEPVIISRRPPPSGGGGAHILNTSGASFAVLSGGIATMRGGLYSWRHNFAVAAGGTISAIGTFFKGAYSRFWLEAGSTSSFEDCTFENWIPFFNRFPTPFARNTFRGCGAITKEVLPQAGFDAEPSLITSPAWLATAAPIGNIWGGSWLRVENSIGGSSYGWKNDNPHPWHSGIGDSVQDVNFRVRDVAGLPVSGFNFYAIENNDGNRRRVQQYTGQGPFFDNLEVLEMLWTTEASGLSNTVRTRLKGGVTTATPTTTPGSGNFVDAQYTQTADDRYAVYGFGYGYALVAKTVQCRANGVLTVEETALPDFYVTLSETAAVAKLASSFTVSTAGVGTITVTGNSTYDDLYDALKAYKTRPVIAQLKYPSLTTLPARADGLRLETDMAIVINPGVTLSNKVMVDGVNMANFDSLSTTGTVTLANGAVIANTTVSAAALTLPPSSLANSNGADITGPITCTTATPQMITLTDVAIRTSINNPGAGPLVIRLLNSTVAASSGNIVLEQVTSLTLDGLMEGSQIHISNGAGQQIEYVPYSGNSYSINTTGSTGTFSYAVAKYGFITATGTFTPATASFTFLINLVANGNVIEALEYVKTYTELTTAQEIYDYISYYNTTNPGIANPVAAVKSPGAIDFVSSNVALDPGAAAVMSGGATLTIKTTGLVGGDTYYSTGNFTLGAATLSADTRIRMANLNSELVFMGVSNIDLYSSSIDRNNRDNLRMSITESPYRFQYGATVSGVLFASTLYSEATAGVQYEYDIPINNGNSVLALDTTTLLLSINNAMAKQYTLLANTSSIADALATKPTLAQIEASSVLAKEATAQSILGASV